MKLTKLFNEFFNSEKSGGLILLLCSALSLIIANSAFGEGYLHVWHRDILSKPIEFWINDGLMTIFFLLVGLEIEREIYIGELSNIKKSLLPIFAAVGGMLFPAVIHFIFNNGTDFQRGFGIPMATDIAFSLGILSLLGSRVPAALKVFLTALAIIDDLGAIIIIALFYSTSFSFIYFGLAVFVFAIMLIMNRAKIYKIWLYLLLGCVMWYFMYKSGIHPTITGVLLAFAIPFGTGDEKSPSYILQHNLHKTVAFLILPLFALANTAIVLPSSIMDSLTTSNSIGIILGLMLGKPLGIFISSIIGAAAGLCTIPKEISKKHLIGVGLLAGIGFTMSIFITLLAFSESSIVVDSKISVLIASLAAGTFGFFFLHFTLPKKNILTEEK
ncbi:MAG: Na+/H+ antiporter NhaA [Ignavibacteriaceae bacterium]|nr:Na+/H+ antiporter NhaA [Ignavibacteriaceae bacterium]